MSYTRAAIHAGPTPYQLETLTMPQSGLLGYYFPYITFLNSYDSSSFDSSYSDNTISRHEIDILLNEVNSHPLTKLPSCSLLVFLIPLAMCLMFAGIVFFMTRVIIASSSRHPSPLLIISGMMGIIFSGVFLIMCIAFYAAKNQQKRAFKRSQAITEILKRHQATTFASRNVIIRLPQHAGYIAIEFK